MRRMTFAATLSLAIFAGITVPASAAESVVAGIWETEFGCAPAMFGYVRNLDQLVQAIDWRSRNGAPDYTVKIAGDTVRVSGGGQTYVYRFDNEFDLKIIRFSRVGGRHATGVRPAVHHPCR